MTIKDQIEIAEQCGLKFDKIVSGVPQFIGTYKQFNDYEEEMDFAERCAEEGEEAKNEALRDAREF
jgi:hypothetical protein